MKDGQRTDNFWVKDLLIDGSVNGAGLTHFSEKTNVWYVDTNKTVDVTGNGTTWTEAFLTITEALAAAGDNDVIFVAPGDYDEGAALAVTQDGLKIIGPGNDHQNVVLILSDTASHHLMTIDANNVEIAGLGFTQTKDNYNGIVLAGTEASYKVHIHDCRFDGYSAGEYAIKCDDTNDAPDLLVENCVFRSWQTACIYANATRDIYRNNKFLVTTAKTGIVYVPDAGDRPDGLIYENYFLGASGTTTVGVSLSNTPTAGLLLISQNYFAGTWDTTIEASTATACVNNYVADASGGGLIDGNS